jgi:hypothetical protein
MLDTLENVDVKVLALKTYVIAEALSASIYNVSGIGTAFSGSLVSYNIYLYVYYLFLNIVFRLFLTTLLTQC